jgi:hypothetical protein
MGITFLPVCDTKVKKKKKKKKIKLSHYTPWRRLRGEEV